MTEEKKVEKVEKVAEKEEKEEAKAEAKVLTGDFTVVTSDGKEIVASFNIFNQSKVVRDHYDVAPVTDKMPLTTINSATFERIVAFYKNYENKAIPRVDKPLKTNKAEEIFRDEWLRKFLDIPVAPALFDIVAGCDLLGMEDLKQLAACAIAAKLWGKTNEEIRTEYKIDPELTPANDKTLKEFFAWADQLWP